MEYMVKVANAVPGLINANPTLYLSAYTVPILNLAVSRCASGQERSGGDDDSVRFFDIVRLRHARATTLEYDSDVTKVAFFVIRKAGRRVFRAVRKLYFPSPLQAVVVLVLVEECSLG